MNSIQWLIIGFAILSSALIALAILMTILGPTGFEP